ncbi:MAG: nucleotidyltransferase family protein [Gaiellaceae bacterium]
MKGLILAAGYATRLSPLTDSTPKMLLQVGGRPVLDWIWDKLREVELDALHLVTNARYAPQLAAWAAGKGVTVHDDGTTSNDDRLGAIGDVAFVADREGWDGEDLLVVAGDNLFDFSLAEFVAFWDAKERSASALAVYEHPLRELASQYGIVELGSDDRVEDFVEKPAVPQSNLVATAAYIYDRAHLALLRAYLADGESPDAPGNFIAWLYSRAPVYGYRFAGEWLDIGDRTQLREADERYSSR